MTVLPAVLKRKCALIVILITVIVIIHKFERNPLMSKTEAQYLFRTASNNLSLPTLAPYQDEDNTEYISRVKTMIESSITTSANTRGIRHLRNHHSETLQLALGDYEGYKQRKNKQETARKIADEIRRTKILSSQLRSFPVLPDTIFTRNVQTNFAESAKFQTYTETKPTKQRLSIKSKCKSGVYVFNKSLPFK